MCEHCGYKPGKSNVVQVITIFEREPDENGESLGLHLDSDAEYVRSEEFAEKHGADALLEVGQYLDALSSSYLSEAFNRAAYVIGEMMDDADTLVADGSHLRLMN